MLPAGKAVWVQAKVMVGKAHVVEHLSVPLLSQGLQLQYTILHLQPTTTNKLKIILLYK